MIATLTHLENASTTVKYILPKRGPAQGICNLDQGDLEYSQGCRSILGGKTDRTRLNHSFKISIIKVIPGWVSCNSLMTCSCLIGGTSNPTAPQNASILNTWLILSTKEWQHLCRTCTKLVPIKIKWLTLAITGCLQPVPSFNCWAFTRPLSVVSVKFTMSSGMGVFFGGFSQWHPTKAISMAIFVVLDLCLRV